jgi:hypothetical protein
MDKMDVRGAKDNAFLADMKQKVNKAVEMFIDASKEAEDRMSFKAFTLGGMDIEAQYKLSDVIFTQTAIHLKEYTHDDIEKYTFATSVVTEKNEADEECLSLWYHFSREKPSAAEKVELTDKDINPYKKEELPVIEEEAVEEKEPVIRGATYDA